ncbi:MAG: hypothetical protein AAF411_11950 [Myxococcota bacterium]
MRTLKCIHFLWGVALIACDSPDTIEDPMPGSSCASYGVECVCPDGTTACAPYSNGNICPCGGDSYNAREGSRVVDGPLPVPGGTRAAAEPEGTSEATGGEETSEANANEGSNAEATGEANSDALRPEDATTGNDACATRRPTLEAVALPTSFRVLTDQQRAGTVQIDRVGALTFEANNAANAADISRARSAVERIQSNGHVTVTYSARTREVRARCAMQVERDASGFAAAVQRRLRESGFTVLP